MLGEDVSFVALLVCLLRQEIDSEADCIYNVWQEESNLDRLVGHIPAVLDD